jgi:alkanesulfonate monooxygenase SsuD/methylene tetrahydromethanopterin reductase-like flavin-dependent oxidoreductase (luciferase family)
MSQVQFGWMIPTGSQDLARADFVSKVKQGLDLIANRFDSAWLPDHLQFGDRPFLEGWTALTYFAAQRPELKYGHIVLCQLFRNPALLAKMSASFQYLSQGNFILGIGAGWEENECRAYDIPFPPPGQRVEELEETLQIIKALWREDHVTFEGKYHRVTDAFCQPKPEPIPPIMVAAFQPRMMRLAARHADWWNIGASDLAKTREQVEMLDKACEAVGRDPASLRRTAMVGCYCAESEQEVKRLTAMHKGPFGLGFVGTPEQVAEQMQPYVQLGINYFMISAGGFPDFTSLHTLSNKVLPMLNRQSAKASR